MFVCPEDQIISGDDGMIELRELGQWRRLTTPLIVSLFFWGAISAAVVAGLFGLMGR
jgi:hypothetical protein